jgi:heterotetrameric sarcosine oxidase gamma subunit
VDDPRGIHLAEEAFLTQVDLRVPPANPAMARIERATGLVLPREPNRVAGDESNAALWLGPDEWLLIAPDGHAERVNRAVRAALADSPGSVVDVSANRTTLRLSGTMARQVLEKICALDLHPRAFHPGQCAQTLLGRTQVASRNQRRTRIACVNGLSATGAGAGAPPEAFGVQQAGQEQHDLVACRQGGLCMSHASGAEPQRS